MEENPYQPPAPAEPIKPPAEPVANVSLPTRKPQSPEEVRRQGCILVGFGFLCLLTLGLVLEAQSSTMGALLAGICITTGISLWVQSLVMEWRERRKWRR